MTRGYRQRVRRRPQLLLSYPLSPSAHCHFDVDVRNTAHVTCFGPDLHHTLLGPDILCWGSGFFIKNPHDAARVTWHQDSTYWGLSKPDIVTAWVALTFSTRENGCMHVIPGTHRLQPLPHQDTFAPEIGRAHVELQSRQYLVCR